MYQVEASFNFDSKLKRLIVVPFNAEVSKFLWKMVNMLTKSSWSNWIQPKKIRAYSDEASRLKLLKNECCHGRGNRRSANCQSSSGAAAEIKLREYNIEQVTKSQVQV